jgi:hypothetical protein
MRCWHGGSILTACTMKRKCLWLLTATACCAVLSLVYVRTHGSSAFIREDSWPEFAQEQIELLVKDGFDRREAERLYAPTDER